MKALVLVKYSSCLVVWTYRLNFYNLQVAVIESSDDEGLSRKGGSDNFGKTQYLL